MYSDVFAVQLWDRDVIGSNNLIGEARINLNRIHRIIQKAVKRGKPVKASMRIREKNFVVTDRFWFDVYNHHEKDEFGTSVITQVSYSHKGKCNCLSNLSHSQWPRKNLPMATDELSPMYTPLFRSQLGG